MSDKTIKAMTGGEVDATAEETRPSVQAYGRIPVSKQMGQVWKARHKQAVRRRRTHSIDEAWAQAVKYYENDQASQRSAGADGRMHGGGLAEFIDPTFRETENLVFSNVVSTVPLLYAKNPGVEVTSPNEDLKQITTDSERLVNVIFSKRESPGIAAKGKIRRAILSAILCNLGVVEVGWYFKDDISANAAGEMEELLSKLEKADKAETIRDLEGQIMLLEEQMDLYEEEGPFIKYHAPVDVLRDPNSVEEDLSDADWIMIRQYRKTKWLKAKFAQKNSRRSLYEPTHLLSLDNTDGGVAEGDDDAYDAFDPKKSHSELGYASKEEYEECQVAAVWYVWDRVTRRLLLFHEKDWSWPIWVYNDPYKLTTFFPIVPLSFYNSVKGGESKGEVAYYLDQQDAINLCNTVGHQIRSFAASKIFYDKNKVARQEVERILSQPRFSAIGIDVPEGMKLEDVIPRAAEHPAAKMAQLFDKTPHYAAIDRIASTSEVMRGGQFKTNTTNDAVQFYQGAMQNRFDDLVDSVEDFVGQIAYLLLQLCWRNMDSVTVSALLGMDAGARWRVLEDEEIKGLSVQIVGSSTMKPTGANKRREALEVGQVLGQFAKATPIAAMVTLRMFERAFDGVTIKEEEWQLIQQSLQQAMMPPAPPPGPGAPNSGGDGLPPEIQRAYDELVQSGVPPQVALEQIKKVVTNGSSKPN